ncbi:arginine--tRNA ligase [Capnocytophaga gingivalis]|jgi:arginine--tRNA ligase|uniref:Arginine--tRNA ligase n=1 Tax=Capnocytophaga gingivalis TaxID=1017 RepID=A0A250FT31_9FLAO|nr:arginine--tRNA ligase [Capnocytophaga gingivalis]ATA87156.1 arginine--tRNA ligase [Capnocytophaga gingivalis]
MSLQEILLENTIKGISSLYGIAMENVEIQQTRKEFEGDYTLVLFPLLKHIKANPQEIGEKLGDYLSSHALWQGQPIVSGYNVVKGFLNLSICENYFLHFLHQIAPEKDYGKKPITKDSPAVIVEYSSPNTNKPLHLGHIRNNLLGFSMAKIIEATGKKVYKTQIINDRGIHICKSMIAWQLFGKGETPESTGEKGDKLVGKYYVLFDKAYKEEIAGLISAGKTKEEAEREAPIFLKAQEMLRLWEQGDPETLALWRQMNQWVYDGFEVTYHNLGVSFDRNYYESETYLLGKDIVQRGLDEGVFYRKEDGSVWIDLTAEGLDEKLVLRSDGTSVYITQDLGTATKRIEEDFPKVEGMIYTVGNEQDYHFKVLFLILQKLGYTWAKNLYHLSYGMVELPNGKMKSREGTVVDADDLMEEMVQVAQELSQELGKLEGYSDQQKEQLYRVIGLGALKYYILKVDPKKKIAFNPQESIDFQGNTGPFIQYTYARIQSILRRAENCELPKSVSLHPKEKELIKLLSLFPEVIQNAADTYSPALIANYVYDLVKEFNSFYQNVSILGEEDTDKRSLRVHLSRKVGEVIAIGFDLLGIEVPERM